MILQAELANIAKNMCFKSKFNEQQFFIETP